MKLSDFMNSINSSKENLIRNSDSPAAAEKFYPPFPVARSLSYHADAILLVNELNLRGTASHAVSSKQHYEFLLHALPARRRFAKWRKPEIDEKINIICTAYGYSYDKAVEVIDILTDEEIENLKQLLEHEK